MPQPLFTVKTTFHKAKLNRIMTDAKHDFVNEAGEEVLARVQSTIHRQKSPSKPGNPPHSPTGRLKKSLAFGMGGTSKDPHVVAGALKGRSTSKTVRIPNGESIPNILEHGGKIQVREQQTPQGTWRRFLIQKHAESLITRRLPLRWRIVVIVARPFVVPALKYTARKLAKLWKNRFKE